MPPTNAIFQLVLARPVLDSTGQEHSHLVHLAWQLQPPESPESPAPEDSWCFQIYVDGRLNALVPDPLQRQATLLLDRSHPRRIQMLALPLTQADELHQPRPDLLEPWQPDPSAGVCLALRRDPLLPPDTAIRAALDGQTLPLRPLWDGSDDRGGFGALFGVGDFGFDHLAAPGLGLGELGRGPLGFDDSSWRLALHDLSPGAHNLTLAAVDPAGQSLTPDLHHPFTLDPLPTPAADLRLDPDFTLHWT